MTPQANTVAPVQVERHPHHVVHPLFDQPEAKIDSDNVPPMELTPAVKASLLALRAYLIVMGVMLVYHFLDLAGFLGHHLK